MRPYKERQAFNRYSSDEWKNTKTLALLLHTIIVLQSGWNRDRRINR